MDVGVGKVITKIELASLALLSFVITYHDHRGFYVFLVAVRKNIDVNNC